MHTSRMDTRDTEWVLKWVLVRIAGFNCAIGGGGCTGQIPPHIPPIAETPSGSEFDLGMVNGIEYGIHVFR